MPPWKFSMWYKGEFTRPAGLIYDCVDPSLHYWPDMEIAAGTQYDPDWMPPPEWKRYVGIDFGAPNFAAIFLAEETGYHELEGPTRDGQPIYRKTESGHLVKWSRYWADAEYRPDESKTAAEHVKAMRAIEPGTLEYIAGGSMSEGQWRSEFKAANFNVREPDVPTIEIHLDRVYSLFREQRLIIMRHCPRLIADIESYSRPVDEQGNACEGILDAHLYHSADSLRYIVSFINRKSCGWGVGIV